MVLMGREVKVSEQEKALARLADVEENDRIQASTIRELQDRIALDEDRLVQGLESVDRWTRGELEHILQERTRGIASRDAQISQLQGSLSEARARGTQAKDDFLRARGEKDQLERRVASLRGRWPRRRQRSSPCGRPSLPRRDL